MDFLNYIEENYGCVAEYNRSMNEVNPNENTGGYEPEYDENGFDTVQAMIASKGKLDYAVILNHITNNNVIAGYQGLRFTAVYNPFTGLYYVDDKYGRIK